MVAARNGVDLIGWRGCAKQKELGHGRFVHAVRIMATAAELAPNVPQNMPSEAAAVSPDRRRQLQQYREIREGAHAYAQGTPECATCPISAGRPYGCYHFVHFPFDEVSERSIFEFFSSDVVTERSICEQLYKELVSSAPTSGTPWHTDRGPEGGHALLPQPLEHKWGFILSRKRIDSAQVLSVLFFTQKRLGLIAAFARFWREFFQFARARGVQVAASSTLMELSAVTQFYQAVEELAMTESSVAIISGEES
jgi:hypothetical protein